MSNELLDDPDGRDDVRLLRFLNVIGPLDEPIAWIASFRDAIVDLLGDVDRASVSLNLQSFDAEHRIAYGHGMASRITPLVMHRSGPDAPADRLVAEARDQGVPVGDYHPPTVFTYAAGERTYLGAIVLWQLRTSPAISERSLEMLNELRPFITYRFVECIARMVRDERVERSVGSLAAAIGARAGLSDAQREILALVASGMSFGAIGARLGIAPATVRRHLEAIYRRTGTYDVAGIIRRFVAPAPEE